MTTNRFPEALRIALEDFDSMESLGPTTEAVIDAAQKWYLASHQKQSPIVGEKFIRAWVRLEELPGGMMIGPNGRFGPVPASTSCWITTSENECNRLRAEGRPMLEIWASHPTA